MALLLTLGMVKNHLGIILENLGISFIKCQNMLEKKKTHKHVQFMFQMVFTAFDHQNNIGKDSLRRKGRLFHSPKYVVHEIPWKIHNWKASPFSVVIAPNHYYVSGLVHQFTSANLNLTIPS